MSKKCEIPRSQSHQCLKTLNNPPPFRHQRSHSLNYCKSNVASSLLNLVPMNSGGNSVESGGVMTCVDVNFAEMYSRPGSRSHSHSSSSDYSVPSKTLHCRNRSRDISSESSQSSLYGYMGNPPQYKRTRSREISPAGNRRCVQTKNNGSIVSKQRNRKPTRNPKGSRRILNEEIHKEVCSLMSEYLVEKNELVRGPTVLFTPFKTYKALNKCIDLFNAY
eukprot:UN31933